MRAAETKRPAYAGLLTRAIDLGSSRIDFVGLQAFLSLHHLEAHLLSFLKTLEAVTLNCAEMYEDVGAILAADETETLRTIYLCQPHDPT
jgi:hypothetical protein